MQDILDLIFIVAAGSLACSLWLLFHQKYSSCSAVAMIGALAGFAVCVASPIVDSKTRYVVPGACFSICQILTLFLSFRRTKQIQTPPNIEVQRIAITLGNKEVVLCQDSYCFPNEHGICWHCGSKNAPLQVVRLTRILFLGAIARVEEIELPVPICEHHSGNINLGAIWMRIISWPGGFTIGAVAGGALGDLGDRGHKWATILAPVAVLGGMSFGLWLWITANRIQTFRLVRLDVKNRLIVVQFNDPNRAGKIRSDLATRKASEGCGLKSEPLQFTIGI